MEWNDALSMLSEFDSSTAGLNRRRFLQAVGAGAAISTLPAWMGELAGAATLGPNDGVLVQISLAGGNDLLNTVVPSAGRYFDLRSDTAMRQTRSIGGGLGLHPSLEWVHGAWGRGQVAIVQGIGMANPNLSHFESMARWMSGHAKGITSTGWLGRFLDGLDGDPLRGVTIGTAIPLHLKGAKARATGMGNSNDGALGAERTRKHWETGAIEPHPENLRMFDAFALMAANRPGTSMADQLAFLARDAVDLAGRIAPVYDNLSEEGWSLVRQMEIAARLINADLGVRVINVTLGGFDTHDDQATVHADLLASVDKSLRRFFETLDPRFAGRTTVFTCSEFGRRAEQNDSRGTDHGTASGCFVIGPKVKGGLYGQYPSLTQLDRDDNLVATVDYRSLYATLLRDWLRADDGAILGGGYERLGLFSGAPG